MARGLCNVMGLGALERSNYFGQNFGKMHIFISLQSVRRAIPCNSDSKVQQCNPDSKVQQCNPDSKVQQCNPDSKVQQCNPDSKVQQCNPDSCLLRVYTQYCVQHVLRFQVRTIIEKYAQYNRYY